MGGDDDSLAVSTLPVINLQTASSEQILKALNKKKPNCSGLVAEYKCGNNDIPVYTGSLISVGTGDEVAMNSMRMTVVSIDGSGNGFAQIIVPAMNKIKLNVALEGIQVAEGGCVVAGKASFTGANLDAAFKQKLDSVYALYNAALDIIAYKADDIAKGYTAVSNKLEEITSKLTEKKRNTKKFLESYTLDQEAELTKQCTEIAADSKAVQDSLSKIIGLVRAGKLKADTTKLKAACKANIAFMNKLAPALAKCQGIAVPAPQDPNSCKGPCQNPWDLLPESILVTCGDDMAEVFGVGDDDIPAPPVASGDDEKSDEKDNATFLGLYSIRRYADEHPDLVKENKEKGFTYWLYRDVEGEHCFYRMNGREYFRLNNDFYITSTCVKTNSEGEYTSYECFKIYDNKTKQYEDIILQRGVTAGEAAADRLAKLFFIDAPLTIVTAGMSSSVGLAIFETTSGIGLDVLTDANIISQKQNIITNIGLALLTSNIASKERLLTQLEALDIAGFTAFVKKYKSSLVEQFKAQAELAISTAKLTGKAIVSKAVSVQKTSLSILNTGGKVVVKIADEIGFGVGEIVTLFGKEWKLVAANNGFELRATVGDKILMASEVLKDAGGRIIASVKNGAEEAALVLKKVGGVGSTVFRKFSKTIDFGLDITKKEGEIYNILGRVNPTNGTIGTQTLYNELIAKGVPISELTGLFQRIPDSYKKLLITDQNVKYWKEINKVHIDNIISNGGPIRFIHDPRLLKNQFNVISQTATDAFSILARSQNIKSLPTFTKWEYEYLLSKGYRLLETGLMIK